MALLIITVQDTPDGQTTVGLAAEPNFDPMDPPAETTDAQQLALRMLAVMAQPVALLSE